MIKNKQIKAYLEQFKATHGVKDSQFGEAYQFGDTELMANELADLVNRGIKTATTSAADLYEPGELRPQVGNYDIILDAQNQPVCITKTKVVETIPYDQVSAEHAYHEGEGDRTLTYWKRVHEPFFRKEYQAAGKKFNPKIPCICEVFQVVDHYIK